VAIAFESVASENPAQQTRGRLVGLDGIRGLAALFVVVNHIFLRAFPGYPADRAPIWATEFRYGRFAVVVFIVLSGFSLSVGPARAGWRLDDAGRFGRRRAWRILPPYWAALGFSLLMTWFVLAQPGWPVPTAKSAVVNGLLVQDVFTVPSPNRAFWSIAIEAQLYLIFPLLILAVRRLNTVVMVALVAAPVLALGLCGAIGYCTASALLTQYTPDLAVLFAIGVAAAGILTATESRRARPWHWYALGLVIPVFALIGWQGPVWTIDHLFWIDLAFGPAIGCLLVAVATGRPRPLVSLLDCRPLRRLGSFSYSLYLTHAPIVIAVYYGLLAGRVPHGVPMFLVLCAVVLPLTVLFARIFAEVFELPFQRRRGWRAIRDALHLLPHDGIFTIQPSRPTWRSCRPQAYRHVPGGVPKICVGGEQDEVVRYTQLPDQRVHRSELNSLASAGVAQRSGSDVVLARRLNELQRVECRMDRGLSPGRDKALQQF
jgi:peptidoglycan/LPS O-acetylase OafA/YrhL